MLVHGNEAATLAVREEVAHVLAPMGLRLSEAKTQVVHMGEGFDFLGFHIQWRRKKGTDKWYVYTFVADRPIRSLKAKIRALTHRKSQQDLGYVLTRLNQIMHGWAHYFKHAVASLLFETLDQYTWWRVIRMVRYRYRWKWRDIQRWLRRPDGSWRLPYQEDAELRRIAAVPNTRYRWRGTRIPNPYLHTENA